MQALTQQHNSNLAFAAIDWQHDDGVNWHMTNDFLRNQFYDRVLSEHVRDQHCVDIGFGTGLLSMLALKHGAQKITAYENHPVRYSLGQHIIESLGLGDKIELCHATYRHQRQVPGRVLFSETVNGNLWGESLWQSLPKRPGTVFLPGQYWVKIYGMTVSDHFAYQSVQGNTKDSHFAPGVDMDPEFCNIVSGLSFNSDFDIRTLEPGIHRLGSGVETVWGPIPWQRLTHESATVMASYCLDVSQGTLTKFDARGTVTTFVEWDKRTIELEIDTSPFRDQCLMLIPRMGMTQGQHTLTLDLGHWGPAVCSIVAVKPNAPIGITHRTTDGGLLYNYR
jgi:hypothetical protein